MALKASIGIFLLRITIIRTHRVLIWMVVIAIEVYSTAYFFLFVLQCIPSAYFWNRFTGGQGRCIPPKVTVDATYAYSSISCLADWTLAIVPIFIVKDLNMNFRTKIVVALILAMGSM